ncbi:DNA cytosine methyltransferase [Lysinibacillus sp. VIII_CA]|uniref:DNA cytosine methyltransferase n=1 Tax=Lysinibacillus sp. VIII_CA TaxID=3417452 RepID=UPI003CED9872
MKFLDLFAGVGGFRFGMEAAGHECVGFVEIDKYARKSYEAIHNTKGEWTAHDITSVTDDDIRGLRDRGPIDIICGGFPCQAFSVAGKRKGFDDTRGTLFFEIARFANIIRPQYLFLENVKGLLNHDGGITFEVILRTLDELGYDAEWQVLNSKDFGVPQNRERVFIIGHLRGRSTRKVFPIRGTSSEANSIDIIAHRKGYRRNTQVFNPTGITETLDTGQGGGRGHYTVSKVGNVNPSGNGMNGQVYSCDGLSPTLTTNKGEGLKIVQPVLTPDRAEKRQNGRRFKNDGEPMFTLTAQDRHGFYDGNRIRKLTPRECWRLQSYPDWAFDKAAAVNSDSQLYKQAGNGVTANVIEAIAEKLV